MEGLMAEMVGQAVVEAAKTAETAGFADASNIRQTDR
jgi:hypothetical protein